MHDDEEQEDDRSRDVNFENNGFTMIFLNVILSNLVSSFYSSFQGTSMDE